LNLFYNKKPLKSIILILVIDWWMTFLENILDVGASNKFVIEGTEREGI
jgi:hypothetical protein